MPHHGPTSTENFVLVAMTSTTSGRVPATATATARRGGSRAGGGSRVGEHGHRGMVTGGRGQP
jgi:hypothetical protein